jgi:hypothetical protein
VASPHHSIIHSIRLDYLAVNSFVCVTCKWQEIDVKKSGIQWPIKKQASAANKWRFLVADKLLKTLGPNPYLATV